MVGKTKQAVRSNLRPRCTNSCLGVSSDFSQFIRIPSFLASSRTNLSVTSNSSGDFALISQSSKYRWIKIASLRRYIANGRSIFVKIKGAEARPKHIATNWYTTPLIANLRYFWKDLCTGT